MFVAASSSILVKHSLLISNSNFVLALTTTCMAKEVLNQFISRYLYPFMMIKVFFQKFIAYRPIFTFPTDSCVSVFMKKTIFRLITNILRCVEDFLLTLICFPVTIDITLFWSDFAHVRLAAYKLVKVSFSQIYMIGFLAYAHQIKELHI